MYILHVYPEKKTKKVHFKYSKIFLCLVIDFVSVKNILGLVTFKYRQGRSLQNICLKLQILISQSNLKATPYL